MEIITLLIFISIMLAMALIGKKITFVGFVGGIGLMMLGFMIMTSGVQIQTGSVIVTTGATNTITNTYTNIETVFAGINWFNAIFSIVIGAAGLFVVISEVNG